MILCYCLSHGEREKRGMNILYAILYLILLGVASHYVGQWLPRRWFHPDRFPFRSWKWEQEGSVYRRLGIQHWKDLVPDMSKILPDMVPKRVSSRETAEEAMILVQETCVAEVVHAALMVLAIGIVLICPNGWGVALALFDALLLNLPYILIQRYNRPKLLRLAEKLRRKEEKRLHEIPDSDL